MRIRSVGHKGLRRFIESDDVCGLPAPFVEKIRNIVSFVSEMQDESELQSIPSWRAHRLSGGRKGEWALHVSRNWRISLAIDRENNEIARIDFEDYH